MSTEIKVEIMRWVFYVALPLIGAWLGKRFSIPANVREYMKYYDCVLEVVEIAAANITASPEQRRINAVDLVVQKTGIPKNVANYLVEKAYQEYRKRTGK